MCTVGKYERCVIYITALCYAYRLTVMLYTVFWWTPSAVCIAILLERVPGITDSSDTQRGCLPPGVCGRGSWSTLLPHIGTTTGSEAECPWKTVNAMPHRRKLREKEAFANILWGHTSVFRFILQDSLVQVNL